VPGKTRTGYVYYDQEKKSWVARITYRDESGKVRNIKRHVENRTEGKQLLLKLIQRLEAHGEKFIDGDNMNFKKLAEIYEDRKLGPPVYKGEMKVSGLRSYQGLKVILRTLTNHFGTKRIKSITHSDLEKFKLERLKTTTVRGNERSFTSVNRELQLMRAVLNFAKRNGWIVQNPYGPDFSVFGIEADIKHGFTSACKEAGIEDFRFHDCRHTATTRLAQGGLSPLELMRITGHSQLNTLTRYFNQTNEQLKKAAAALDAFNSSGIEN
jgi:integrase